MPQVLAVIYWKYDSTSRYLKIFYKLEFLQGKLIILNIKGIYFLTRIIYKHIFIIIDAIKILSIFGLKNPKL